MQLTLKMFAQFSCKWCSLIPPPGHLPLSLVSSTSVKSLTWRWERGRLPAAVISAWPSLNHIPHLVSKRASMSQPWVKTSCRRWEVESRKALRSSPHFSTLIRLVLPPQWSGVSIRMWSLFSKHSFKRENCSTDYIRYSCTLILLSWLVNLIGLWMGWRWHFGQEGRLTLDWLTANHIKDLKRQGGHENNTN